MSLDRSLLELLEKAVVTHGGDLGGWTRLDDEKLQVFDGRVTLTAKVDPPSELGYVHAHVFATLHDYGDEVLDACMTGVGQNHDEMLGQAVFKWVTGVAGPIRSFLDDKPVCMTGIVGGGDPDQDSSSGNCGFVNVKAFVGPSLGTGDGEDSQIDDTKPWFGFAAESAAARKIHLAKVTLAINPQGTGWQRNLEVDGHEVSHVENDWQAGVPVQNGLLSIVRYAVFEFPANSKRLKVRAALDQTIECFIKKASKFDNIDALTLEMEKEGYHPQLIYQVKNVSTLAFGRMFFEPRGAQYSPFVTRIRKDGQIQRNVPIMSIPAYNRGRAVLARLESELAEETVQSVCLISPESGAILQALDSGVNSFDGMVFSPSIVADRECSQECLEHAYANLQELQGSEMGQKKKPWWRLGF